MASATEIARLRLLIAEPDEEAYSTADLGTRLDAAAGSADLVARDIWVEKAAALAELASISEGGSSRNLDTLHRKALDMVQLFDNRLAASAAAATGGVRVSKLTRG